MPAPSHFSAFSPLFAGFAMRLPRRWTANPTLTPNGDFNRERFTLKRGAWDHEHCSRCGDTIEPMTLCWVTPPNEDYVLLDEKCYRLVQTS